MSSTLIKLLIYNIVTVSQAHKFSSQKGSQHQDFPNIFLIEICLGPAINACYPCHSVPFHATLCCFVLLFPLLPSAEHWPALRHGAEKHPGTFDFHSRWNITL